MILFLHAGVRMRRLQKLAAVAAALVLASAGAALAAGPEQLFCAAGVSGSKTFSVTAGGTASLEISNETGSTIALSASLSNPAGKGYAGFSGGAKLMTFPGQTTATITAAYSALTFLWLESPDSNVTVTATCNPTSASDQAVSEQGQNPADSTSQTRDQEKDTLQNLVDEIVQVQTQRSRDIDAAVSLLGWDRERLEAVYDYSFVEPRPRPRGDALHVFKTNLGWVLAYIREGWDHPNVIEHYAKMLMIEQHFLNSQGGAMGYASTPTSPAIAAINRAAGDNVVHGSFNLLGYGPNGLFDTSAELARGDNWRIVASANGAISQTSLAAGNTNSISGRGTINFVVSPTANLGLGLALGLGATSEDGVSLDDTAYHYSAIGAASYKISPNLTARGTAGYELTSHNYTVGTAAGTSLSHLFTAGLGLTGSMAIDVFTFAPKLDFDLERENADAASMSDGTTLAGHDRTTGKVTIGGVLSRDFLWDTQNSTIVVTPSLGADTSLSFTDKTTTAGVSSSSTLLGLGLTAGLAFALESGLDLSVSGRVTHAGNTTGAGLTGGLSAGF